ncbi:hypothetical protein BESB_000240 [Besnoitia besnoiti]|uniref:Bromo domain-containing protein n=1 Tax=Besnoitia besnoiti TaxID=94643 RepID=A0A2A9MPF9_BESBE|nr:hypothetical protein BESB_000240 [Besnoitia besnoiti]PFH37682.1 hypothetical protein BESB_000240 [Besnoitia besnoiti]
MEQPETTSAPGTSLTSEGAEAPLSASAPSVSATEGSTPASDLAQTSIGAPVSLSAPPAGGLQAAETSSASAAGVRPPGSDKVDASMDPGAVSSSFPLLDGSIHGLDCARGELLLTEAEARALEERLAAEWTKQTPQEEGSEARDPTSFRTQWRFQPAVATEAFRGAGAKKARKGAGSSSRRGLNALSGLLESAGLKLEPTELSASGRPQRASRSTAAAAAAPSGTSAAAEQPASQSSQAAPPSSASQDASSRRGGGAKDPQTGSQQAWVPSPWVCWMHEVLVELCKQPVCLPFFPRVSPRDAHYPELARKVYPAVPITLESVLDRLERNEYTCTEEVFNDVYTVFLCAFRYYEPGNQYWMMAQEASIVFQALTQNKPLLSCDFDAAVAAAVNPSSASAAAGAAAASARAGVAVPSLPPASASAQSTLGKQTASRAERKGKGGREAGKAGKGAARGRPALQAAAGTPNGDWGSADAATAVPGAPALPPGAGVSAAAMGVVTAQEREAFQQILGQLDMEVHLELYSVFKDRAMWLSFGTGEVELDDASTAPVVFREMVAWCRGRLAEQQQRQAAAASQHPHAPNAPPPAGHSAPAAPVMGPGSGIRAAYAGIPLGASDPAGGSLHPAATKRPATNGDAGAPAPSPSPSKKLRSSLADSASSSSSDAPSLDSSTLLSLPPSVPADASDDDY